MKIAASMSVGRLAPKHSLNIDGIRAISKNVTPKLIKNDVILIDRLRGQDGKHLTIEEYTDQHFQPYIDQEIYFRRSANRLKMKSPHPLPAASPTVAAFIPPA